jgi:hypothetical protein
MKLLLKNSYFLFIEMIVKFSPFNFYEPCFTVGKNENFQVSQKSAV